MKTINAIKAIFGLFAGHAKRIVEGLERFKARREEIEQRMKAGARRR